MQNQISKDPFYFSSVVETLKTVGDEMESSSSKRSDEKKLYVSLSGKKDSFQEISGAVKEALASEDLTPVEKKTMLDGYGKIIKKYNEKTSHFLTYLFAYFFGQAQEVEKAENMIKENLKKYAPAVEQRVKEIMLKYDPINLERELRTAISERENIKVEVKKQLEDFNKELKEFEKGKNAKFTVQALIQDVNTVIEAAKRWKKENLSQELSALELLEKKKQSLSQELDEKQKKIDGFYNIYRDKMNLIKNLNEKIYLFECALKK